MPDGIRLIRPTGASPPILQARAGAAPPGKISNTARTSPAVAVALPGSGPLTGSTRRPSRKRSAAGQDIRHGTCNCRAAVALPGLQGPLTGSYPVGPRRRSAAGQDIRHGTCDFADGGYALSGLGASSQAHTRRPRASAAPPGKISGTVPVISPGGGYALPGLQGLSQAQTSQARVSAQRHRA